MSWVEKEAVLRVIFINSFNHEEETATSDIITVRPEQVQSLSRMALLDFMLILLLLFEVGSSQEQIHRFYKPGQNVILPCGLQSSRGPQCSNIRWLYKRDSSETKNVVSNGKVDQSSQQAARLSVNTNCSLVIRQATSEDVGLYTCRPFDNERFDVHVYLSRLNIFLFDQTRDVVTLECSLLRFEGLRQCRQNALRWVDDTGTELREGVKMLNRGADCFSRLTVKRQSGNNRRYVCQYVNKENRLDIEAEYTPVFTGTLTTQEQNFTTPGKLISSTGGTKVNTKNPGSGTIPRTTSGTFTTQEQNFTTPAKLISSTGGTKVNTKNSSEWRPLSYIMLTLRVLELICISIIIVKVYRLKGEKQTPSFNRTRSSKSDVAHVRHF
ncbi:uncharacterized protein LOC109976674 isoform X2 [Xyrichtys novacula]|uniref:Uncharacterized protein LOC109976674 isoform X2 n=1 Tax=Xyrichtys novacula TaxID=13765 RepID=A0AAV1GXA5_XYRNO|nr:uncharacterized protein LOC109976674 isoform X2 [Xyrichtys novacula]